MPVYPIVFRWIGCLALIAAGNMTWAQPETIAFKRLSVEEGLASTHIECILQDSKGFLWFGTWKGLCRYDGYSFKTYRHDPKDSLSLADDLVFALMEDSEGVLWVGTRGLDRFDPETETFTHYLNHPANTFGSRAPTVFELAEDPSGWLWAGSREGLFRFRRDAKSFVRYAHDPADPGSLSDNFVLSLCPDRQGALWVGTTNGLNRLDPLTHTFQRFAAQPGVLLSPATISGQRISSLVLGADSRLYVGTDKGLDICDPRKTSPQFEHTFRATLSMMQDRTDGSWWLGTTAGLYRQKDGDFTALERYHSRLSKPEGISSDVITALVQDREGTIWIGTDNGINYLTPEAFQFRQYKSRYDDPNSLSNNLIYCVIEGRDGLVWLAVGNGGLNCLRPETGQVRRYPFGPNAGRAATRNKDIFRVYEDRFGSIWAGSLSGGIDRLDRQTGTFTPFRWGDPRDLVSFFYEDKDSVLWIGHQGGVSRFDHRTQLFEFAHYAPEEAGKRMVGVVTGILQDHAGEFWVSSNRYFLNRFDPKTMRYQRLQPDPKKPGSISSNNVQAIYEDRNGRLWVGTDKGLDRYDREKRLFRHFDLENGLPHRMLGHLLEDGRGYLWMATGKGISRFDPRTNRFRNFDKSDGLSSDESWDFVKSPSSGAFLLATADGLTIFHPDSLRDNAAPPQVVFTKFTRFNARTGVETEEKGIAEKSKLKLSYLDDILYFEFAALSFRKIPKIQYAYRMEGLYGDWIPLGAKHTLTFTNLAPGTYRLYVKACNGDGVWSASATVLNITVEPPWWATWWACLLYAAVSAGALFWLYRTQLKRRLAAAENRRLRELDAVKTRLYTNITHEFRTPLTVISGMADQLEENPERWLKEGPRIIRRNSQDLLNLVNQMLDLRKLEAGMLPVRLTQGDLVAYVKYLLESFHSYASSKGITLSVHSEWESFQMDFDADKILTIVSNLLSNAIKFTPPGGHITLRLEATPEWFELSVEDTGMGIPPEELPLIFDRFHQANGAAGGSGIGLTLVRELAQLLGGSVRAESIYGQGAVFTVRLPVSRRATPALHWPGARDKVPAFVPSATPESMPVGTGQQPLVQIVEDNPDVVRYLEACLKPAYRLLIAADGKVALEQAFKQIPDLIVSDVMMPEMDGFELCRTLKSDIRTDHIPIVLLTARADTDARLQGLQHGADAYLVKPFHREELLLQIQNLLEGRRALQAHYRAPAEGEPATLPQEHPFVAKARAVVEAQLGDSDFDVERLCRAVSMSNSNLHRKLTALTGHSANHFIRHIRLARACALLRDPERTIAAVADDCGFNDPVYFARVFRQAFGLSPSEWRQRISA